MIFLEPGFVLVKTENFPNNFEKVNPEMERIEKSVEEAIQAYTFDITKF